MTAITPDAVDSAMLRPVSTTQVTRHLNDLLNDHKGRIGWWVELTRQLDRLAESLQQAPGDMWDPPGFTEQVREDAPHLVGRWMRLSAERDSLGEAVREVRVLAGRHAGDPAAVPVVTRSARDLLNRVRRFQERTTEVLLDAYERDIGGE